MTTRPGRPVSLLACLALTLLSSQLLNAGEPAPTRTAQVLLVSTGNLYLDAFFDIEPVRKLVTVRRLAPADLKDKERYAKPARSGAYALVIFDRCGPESTDAMPRSNTLFIGHPPPPWKLRDLKQVEKPVVKTWDNKHPLLRNVDKLPDLTIERAFQLKDLPAGTARLMEADSDTALLLALHRQSFTDLVVAFPLVNDKGETTTNWPLRPSFVIFLSNVLHRLGGVEDAPRHKD
jgi:hypothetical protein